MNKILFPFLLLAFLSSAFAFDVKTGEEVITKMHDKYDGKWYKTLTFVQKTTNYKPDGTSTSEMWTEAMTVPGSLRIDILDKPGDGILFTNGQIYSWREGKANPGRPFVHPLLVLGFDIYMQPFARTIEQVKAMGIDLSSVHEEMWQGRKMYVVGAAQGDLTKPQVWVDKDRLVFTRLFQLGGRDKKIVQETQFNKYEKVKGGGWVSAEVQFFVDGKKTTTEEYTEIMTDVLLSADLWDPAKWSTADRNYYKKK
jgi:hypothetical protein